MGEDGIWLTIRLLIKPAYFERETVHGEHAVSGVVSGLAYAQSGVGDVLRIETTMMPGKGRLTLTGKHVTNV